MQKRRGLKISVESFLPHSAEKIRRGNRLCFRKILVSKILLYKRGGGGVSRFSVVLIKLKYVGKGWDSNPNLVLENAVVLPTVPWEQLEFLTNVSETMKIYGPTKIRTRTYCLRNDCPAYG